MQTLSEVLGVGFRISVEQVGGLIDQQRGQINRYRATWLDLGTQLGLTSDDLGNIARAEIDAGRTSDQMGNDLKLMGLSEAHPGKELDDFVHVITDMGGTVSRVAPHMVVTFKDAMSQLAGITRTTLKDAKNAAQQGGLMAAERTQAQIMAKLSVYGRTAFNATDIALEASKAVPRTMFMPVNKIINAAREKTGDPKIVALGQALMTLSNEYARAIGGGHGTVHDKEAAERRLSAAQTQEQLEAVINVMRKEVVSEERAMPAARQQIRDIYNPGVGGPRGNSIEGEHGAPPPPGPVTGASGLPEGRTGTKGGRPVVVKGGRLIYSDTGEPAQ